MVTSHRRSLVACALPPFAVWLPLADEKTGRLIERLDAPTRAKLIMALLGLVLVGLALIALAMWGGRFVRRIGRERNPSEASLGKQWYSKPLVAPEDKPSGDTRADSDHEPPPRGDGESTDA